MNEFKINDKNKITSGFSTPDGYFSDFSLELNKKLKLTKTEVNVISINKKNKLTKNKNLPNILILIPIHSPQKGHQGFVAINKESEINDSEIELLKHLSGTFGHAFNSFISTFPIKESLVTINESAGSWTESITT